MALECEALALHYEAWALALTPLALLTSLLIYTLLIINGLVIWNE